MATVCWCVTTSVNTPWKGWNALASQGFHLDNSLLCKLKRSLAYFCESVQRRNLAANEPEIKSQQAFIKVYERHLHGDCDETPEEWRSYK